MRRTTALTASCALALTLLGAAAGTDGAGAAPPGAADKPGAPSPTPTAVGRDGAVSSVDPNASQVGLEVLEAGGNAVDAAVATAAALGVTEPYSAGLGGGGYFVYYDAASGEVTTIDGRETAPAAMQPDAFIDPETGDPYPFSPDLVTSGVSVGVPGTPATWDQALDHWGSLSLRDALRPAARLARRGFVVDETFNLQTRENADRFRTFTPTIELFLEDGVPAVGSVFRNRDLAKTYRILGKRGIDWLYDGPLAAEIAATVQEPPLSGETDLPAPPGSMTTEDLADYEALLQDPTQVSYRGYDVFGMAPSSSGGTTVGESLNILETFDLGAMEPADALHHYLEATALAFADRGRYVGDPAYVDVPTEQLLDDTFAKERACGIDPDTAATKPVPAGDVTSYDGVCPAETAADRAGDTEGPSTTHLTTADRWGNVVAYTLTIEQTGGSGIVVPDRGFILNNELTDFSTVFEEADPNRIQPGKRPRSSMSPTIVLQDGEPVLALGSPGGSTIITTVLQVLMNRIDLAMPLPAAVAAPRASQRNFSQTVTAEQAFIDTYGALLEAYGHSFAVPGPPGSSASEIGAVAAIELGPDGLLTAVAEPRRRGGGSALVVSPSG